MKEIKAREGFFLTQANEVTDRIFVTAIKGASIDEAAWREATAEEKEAFEKAVEEANKADNEDTDK